MWPWFFFLSLNIFLVSVPHVSLEVFGPVVHYKPIRLKKLCEKLSYSIFFFFFFLGSPLVSMYVLFCLHVDLLPCFINPVALKLTRIIQILLSSVKHFRDLLLAPYYAKKIPFRLPRNFTCHLTPSCAPYHRVKRTPAPHFL